MDPDKRQRLRKNHVKLKDNLQALPLVDRLYEKGVLSDDECDTVRSLSPQSEQIHCVLEYIKRKGNHGYMVFCDILQTLKPELYILLQETQLDQDITGERTTDNIFFNPSDDFELRSLIDQITCDNKIKSEQLDRMKHFVIGENGCPEEVIEKFTTPARFFRHLMTTQILNRYNLTFLQALLWRVGLRTQCNAVAGYARSMVNQPIHFFTPKEKPENGFAFSKFHVKGSLETFKSISIEDICSRVSRYVGVPPSCVIPAGVEPSESIIITIMLPVEAADFLVQIDDFTWLTDMRVDYIIHKRKVTISKGNIGDTKDNSEVRRLQEELRNHMESEQMVKHCLWETQMSNETLKDMLQEEERGLQKTKVTLTEQQTWNNRLFHALMVSLQFQAQQISCIRALPHSRNVQSFSGKQFRDRFAAAVERAKRSSQDHRAIEELIEAVQLLSWNSGRTEIDNLKATSMVSLQAVQNNFNDVVAYRSAALSLVGLEALDLEVLRSHIIAVHMVFGLLFLDALLQDIVHDFGKRIDDEGRKKVCAEFKVPKNVQLPDIRHRIYEYILLSELEKTGQNTNDEIERIMQAALKATGRKDLWEEFKHRNQLRLQVLANEAESKKQTDIVHRLDKMEKMLQTAVGQSLIGNMGGAGIGHKVEGMMRPETHQFLNKLWQQFPSSTADQM
ncbi:uncharacterized protein LOC124137146 [Haliotis rufescens]|uniref:uncharacterized protein LOC124137146 n=1 Tax=Haliotis rufescens TaxID=6454 RepID=UPI00201F6407|nr:uncharacterized protein LOC124137146 [Haliotis rufescens]XP_046359288.2 uncharacterized protein LOC124137146 [Haliotis rufescens]